MTAGPYASTALSYWQAGWRGILPLPVKKKANPPAGFTGEGGVDPSYADIFTWTEASEGRGNIALRMPHDLIGIDVDDYGGKQGGNTLALCEQKWGTLPLTWRSTSRDDGISGIRLYRVPEGLAWPGEIPVDIEILQRRHRYAIVCPSIHPEGRTYRWLNPAGVVSTAIPDPDELPNLPDAWIEGLTGGELAQATSRNNFAPRQALEWILTLPDAAGKPCPRMQKAVEQMPRALLGSAHAAGRDGALRVLRLASEGHAGAITALAETKRLFVAEATSPNRDFTKKKRRTDQDAQKEWDDFVTSSVNLITANPTPATCDCYGQITGLLVTNYTDGSSALAIDTEPQAVPQPAVDEPPREAPKRMKSGAEFILDAPDEIPAVWGADDDVLWARGEALMIVGPPGVGKTTLCGQIVRSLVGVGDGKVLGYPVEQARRVLYLAMDRPMQIARALARMFTEADRDALTHRMRVWEGPPPQDVARNTDILQGLAEIADADVLIVDSLKDAAVGLTDDEVAAGYNRARQTALAAGIQVLELHHNVKRGQNGAKPNTLADVYGSMHITSGAGSVVLLWGSAGDPIVQLTHLKQPLNEIGPVRLLHDHTHGTTTVFHTVDPIALIAATPKGITARDLARAQNETDDPTDNDIEKSRRRLNKLVTEGRLTKVDEPRPNGSGVAVTRFFTPGVTPTLTHAEKVSHSADDPTRPTLTGKTAGQDPTHDPTPPTHENDAIPHDPTPLFRGGDQGRGPWVDRTTGEIHDPTDDPNDDSGLRWDQR